MKNKSEKSNHEQQIRYTWTTNQKTQIEKPGRSSTNPDLPNPGAIEAVATKLCCVLLHRVLLWVPWASCSSVGSCSLLSDCSSVLRRQIVGSSLGLFFVIRSLVSLVQLLFKYQNRVLETWFNKSKLKSIRLEIYVAFSVQLNQPNTCKASLWDSSFNIDLEFLKLEILVCLYISNAY